MIQSNQVR